MALHVPRPPGISSMLKDGHRYFSGLTEAVYRNIDTCKIFAHSVRTAYGPNGMNKLIINHIEKQFLTSDAATIIRELDIEHPAAKILILGSEMQDSEAGDGTAFVIIFAGALLENAEELLRMGVTPTEVADGYEKALKKCLEILPNLTCYEIKDCRDEDQVYKGIVTAIQSKQYGSEEFLSKLITKACASLIPESEELTFNMDNVRVCKILGAGLNKSEVVQGMVFKRLVEGEITNMKNAKIALYDCVVDVMPTETKGTVLIKTADELMNYARGEEVMLEAQIKAIADAGVNVIVAGAKFGELGLHFVNKYGMLAVRFLSKFDLLRLHRTVGGIILTRLLPPTHDEFGYCDAVYVDEVGDTSVVIFKIEAKQSKVSTIVVRGSTDNYMDDIERAIEDGVNTFRGLIRDGRLLPGAGATEIELALQLSQYADTFPGLEQYSIRNFSKSLETFPKTIADNSGHRANSVVAQLLEAHKAGKKTYGVNIDLENTICDTMENGLLDLFENKKWALKYAVEAAVTVLRVDEIIIAKRAGGPKKSQQGAGDADAEEF